MGDLFPIGESKASHKAAVLIEYCRVNQRVCPQPRLWSKLYDMLPQKKRVGLGWDPSLPLILAAWDTPAFMKQLRLEEHIKWAERLSELGYTCSIGGRASFWP